MTPPANVKYSVKVLVREFGVPPIHDAMVIGNRAAIGCAAIRKAIEFDDVISDIIVRSAILRRMPKEKLIALSQVKPLMTAGEILHLDLEVEVQMEGENL